MKNTLSSGPVSFSVLFCCALAAYLVLMAVQPLYPFLDIPNHLAMATIYKYYGSPANAFSDFYFLYLFPKPNVFHLFFCSLPVFPSVETGNTFFYCIYALLLPLSVLAAIRKLGGNYWFSLLSFLFIYSYSVCYGFVGCTMSVPLVIIIFSITIDYLVYEKRYAAWALSLLLLLFFFVHVLPTLFCLFFVICSCLFTYRSSLLRFCTKAAVALPSAALITWWWVQDTRTYSGSGLFSALTDYYAHKYLARFVLRSALCIYDNYTLYGGTAGYVLACLFSCVVAGALLYSIIKKCTSTKSIAIKPSFQITLIFCGCSLVCFFLMPFELPGFSFLFERFSVYVFLSCILVGSILAPRRLPRALVVILCCAVSVHILLWSDFFLDFQKENKGFTEKMFPEDNRAVLAGLIYDNQFRGRPVYDNFPDYFIVWRQGIATTRVIDDRGFAVRRKADRNTLPGYLTWLGLSDVYDGRYHDVDYILARGSIPSKTEVLMDDFIRIEHTGKWKLYKKLK